MSKYDSLGVAVSCSSGEAEEHLSCAFKFRSVHVLHEALNSPDSMTSINFPTLMPCTHIHRVSAFLNSTYGPLILMPSHLTTLRKGSPRHNSQCRWVSMMLTS